jgi:hypothetical protein
MNTLHPHYCLLLLYAEVHEALEQSVDVLRQLEVFENITAVLGAQPVDEPNACSIDLVLTEAKLYNFKAGTYTQVQQGVLGGGCHNTVFRVGGPDAKLYNFQGVNIHRYSRVYWGGSPHRVFFWGEGALMPSCKTSRRKTYTQVGLLCQGVERGWGLRPSLLFASLTWCCLRPSCTPLRGNIDTGTQGCPPCQYLGAGGGGLIALNIAGCNKC